MTKEDMKQQYDLIEKDIEALKEISLRLRPFMQSQEFKELSDLEAALCLAEHHQIESLARVLIMRAALIGGRLSDPDGDRVYANDETPNPIITEAPGEFHTGHSVKVGGTIITEG